ncbi:MAG: NAD(P)-binding protein [Cyanobacteria bacterium P01_G01_bin.54]
MSTTQQSSIAKQKIAVLGGGLGSLTAVFELTEQPNWQQQYEITVYQLGWRLGGKGASGRETTVTTAQPTPSYRIQEHGYHVFFGFYENALGLMDRCYRALGGQEGFFPSIDAAFKPLDRVVLQEQIDGQWRPWPITYQPNPLKPWQPGDANQSFWEHVQSTLKSLIAVYAESLWPDAGESLEQLLQRLPTLLQNPGQIWRSWGSLYELLAGTVQDLSSLWDLALLYAASELGKTILNDSARTELLKRARDLIRLLDQAQAHQGQALARSLSQKSDANRRLLLISNLAKALTRGVIEHLIIEGRPFEELDHYEFTDWLLQQGAWEATVEAAIVRVYYDLLFGYEGGMGNRAQRRLGTAAALRWMLRLNLAYRGSIIWKMQAGMGDTIFAPVYALLKQRGVKFKFFHRVTHLGLDPSQTEITSIQLKQQANLKGADYDPLIQVKDLWCWPAEPRYDQIVEGEQLKAEHIDLECFWSRWPQIHPEGTLALQRGRDFDQVILGISIGALPAIASELIAAKPQWREMVKQIKTVPTYGAQVWFQPGQSQVGALNNPKLVGAYVEPFSTCADMSYLIDREDWTGANAPSGLAYLTGTIADPGIPEVGAQTVSFPAEQLNQLSSEFNNFLSNDAARIWFPENPPADGVSGTLRSQYLKVNVSPSERYVLSVPGSHQARLKAGESGFANLFLAGDWIDNSMNSGCAEATVMSGMQAARAVLQQACGLPYGRKIIGENDTWLDLPKLI